MATKAMSKKDQTPLFTRREVAERFRVHQVTVWRWEREGKLTPKRLGARTLRYPLSEIERLEANA